MENYQPWMVHRSKSRKLELPPPKLHKFPHSKGGLNNLSSWRLPPICLRWSAAGFGGWLAWGCREMLVISLVNDGLRWFRIAEPFVKSFIYCIKNSKINSEMKCVSDGLGWLMNRLLNDLLQKSKINSEIKFVSDGKHVFGSKKC